jgi:ubiquinone/menaquinone biosynthesis C-methylase UbiE
VDVGGGASRLVDGLLDAGYSDIVVVDIAEAALAKARGRLGSRAQGVRWIASDLLQWTPDAMFDLWHDRAVFHFMVRAEDRSAYLATLRRAVKRGGQVIIATFTKNGPEKCSGLPVERYEPEDLAAQLGPEFRLMESLREEHATPAGRIQAFQYSRFQRVLCGAR